MAISITSGFSVKSSTPIDTRFVLTKAEMVAALDVLMPEKYFAVCEDDGKLYVYDKSIESPSEETGKFKALDIDFGVADDGQILIYNGTSNSWEPANFDDNKSIDYYASSGLELHGFTTAVDGTYPYKDSATGAIAWKAPISTDLLDAAVAAASNSATNAANSATDAATAKVGAETALAQARVLNNNTVNYVNNKFWWGTEEEYNALEELTEGTIYFVQKG